jgi:hypothetical protein
LATKPHANRGAPLTPFTMPEYRVSEALKSASLNTLTGVYADKADQANKRSDNYVLAVVLFASALFFAGISTKVRSLRQREVLLAMGRVIFLGTAIWIATSPVSFSV